jgi:hypothetical protein
VLRSILGRVLFLSYTGFVFPRGVVVAITGWNSDGHVLGRGCHTTLWLIVSFWVSISGTHTKSQSPLFLLRQARNIPTNFYGEPLWSTPVASTLLPQLHLAAPALPPTMRTLKLRIPLCEIPAPEGCRRRAPGGLLPLAPWRGIVAPLGAPSTMISKGKQGIHPCEWFVGARPRHVQEHRLLRAQLGKSCFLDLDVQCSYMRYPVRPPSSSNGTHNRWYCVCCDFSFSLKTIQSS